MAEKKNRECVQYNHEKLEINGKPICLNKSMWYLECTQYIIYYVIMHYYLGKNGVCNRLMSIQCMRDLLYIKKCVISKGCNQWRETPMLYCVNCELAVCKYCIDDGTAETDRFIQIWHGQVKKVK